MTSPYWMEVANHKDEKAFRYYFNSAAALAKALTETATKLPGWEVREVSK